MSEDWRRWCVSKLRGAYPWADSAAIERVIDLIVSLYPRKDPPGVVNFFNNARSLAR